MKRFFMVALLLVGTLALTGCPNKNNDPNANPVLDANATLLRDISIVRAVVAAQPDGPRKTQWLKSIDAITSYDTFAVLVAELATNQVPVPPQLSPTAKAVVKSAKAP